jgi:hypothetical protein
MKNLAFNETNKGLKCHWNLDIYKGDIVKEQIPYIETKKLSFKEVMTALLKDKKISLESEITKYKDGKILNELQETIEGYNLITTVGKTMMLDRLFGLSAVGAMTRIGVGTSSTAAAVGNTSLTGSFFKAYDSTPTRASSVVTCVTTFGTGDGNLEWNELGMDNGTTLLNRIAPIGPFNKTVAVSIVVTVTITQA